MALLFSFMGLEFNRPAWQYALVVAGLVLLLFLLFFFFQRYRKARKAAAPAATAGASPQTPAAHSQQQTRQPPAAPAYSMPLRKRFDRELYQKALDGILLARYFIEDLRKMEMGVEAAQAEIRLRDTDNAFFMGDYETAIEGTGAVLAELRRLRERGPAPRTPDEVWMPKGPRPDHEPTPQMRADGALNSARAVVESVREYVADPGEANRFLEMAENAYRKGNFGATLEYSMLATEAARKARDSATVTGAVGGTPATGGKTAAAVSDIKERLRKLQEKGGAQG